MVAEIDFVKKHECGYDSGGEPYEGDMLVVVTRQDFILLEAWRVWMTT